MKRARIPRYLLGGLALVVIGAGGVLGVAHWSVPAVDTPPPYIYQAAAEDPSEALNELAALVPGSEASLVDLLVEDRAKPIAKAQVLILPDQGELIVGWESAMPQPVLRSDISDTEELALVAALRKHLPGGSTVLAMPALAARLQHFTDADYPLAGRGTLRLPDPWDGQDEIVAEMETRWLAGAPPSEGTGLADFSEALLAEDIYGAARLQTLAGVGDTYVILHVRDIFDLGISLPDRILVGMRDFPAGGQVHDASRAVKDWARDNGHAAYALERRTNGAIRAYCLSEAKDKSTLLEQLLPFNTARIGFVPGTTLVFQTGGYWVYRLQPVTGKPDWQGDPQSISLDSGNSHRPDP